MKGRFTAFLTVVALLLCRDIGVGAVRRRRHLRPRVGHFRGRAPRRHGDGPSPVLDQRTDSHHGGVGSLPVPEGADRHLLGEVRAGRLQDAGARGHPHHDRLQRAGQRRARDLGGSGDGDGHGREPRRRHRERRATGRRSISRRCRTSRRRATPGSCSSARPAISMDRVNVGGNQSGQQSGYISRGASTGNNKWSIDGVDITDMSATGASPIYYDFDMLEEMQVTTGGAGRLAADRRRRHQPRHAQRDGHASRLGPLLHDRRQVRRRTTSPTSCGRRAPAPATRSRTSRTTGSRSAARSRRASAWFWGGYGRRTSKVGVVGFYR